MGDIRTRDGVGEANVLEVEHVLDMPPVLLLRRLRLVLAVDQAHLFIDSQKAINFQRST